MKTPQEIIDLIREDAPCVFDILNEEYTPSLRGYFPQSNSQYTWEDLYASRPDITPPTPQELLDMLPAYSGDNYDTHYWSGRYAQMIEIPILYLCTRYHDTCNSSSANVFVATKEKALAWFKEELTELLEWSKDWLDYSTIEDDRFHFDDGDGSCLIVQIAPATLNTSIDLM